MALGTVRLKPGATCARPAPAGFVILGALTAAAITLELQLTITSGDEGSAWRAATDPHQTGEAYDVSLAGLSDAEIQSLCVALATALSMAQFSVLLEAPLKDRPKELATWVEQSTYWNAGATARHLHIQRRKNTVYPPAALPPSGNSPARA
jgi:hypothetical protein